MSRTQIFTIFILIDLAIVAGVLFCAFQRLPVGKYLIPAIVLFVLNGLWLVVMTIRTTPPRSD
jgi:nucleoside permease NupC